MSEIMAPALTEAEKNETHRLGNRSCFKSCSNFLMRARSSGIKACL